MPTLEEQLEELVAPLEASTLGVGAAEGPEQLNKIQDLLAGSDNPQAGFEWLADRIATLGPTAGCWIGVYLGGLVERGRLDAAISAPGVLRFFRRAVDELQREVNLEEWAGCEGLFGPAVITQLAVHGPTLASLVADEALLEQIAAVSATSGACFYVEGLARQQSGELVLLDPSGERAMVLAYTNVGSCFHLFTLIQSVLPASWSEGRTQPAEMLAVAWGENARTEETAGDSAWFHYCQPVGTADVTASVWGEMTVDSIGRLAGRQVLVVRPMVLKERNWDSGFFAPQLSMRLPSVSVVRPLDDNETIDLIRRLQ